ncbi:MAG: ABC transporter permease [Bacteroidota bacterium]
MLLNYLKIAFRTLKKNRLVSFINIFGLGLSMSVGMMELIIVQSELGYDKFHPHPESTYRITCGYKQKNGNSFELASTPFPLLAKLTGDSTVIGDAVNIYPALNGNANAGEKEFYINGAFTESSFFTVFGFTLEAGNAATALQQPNSVVLTKATAEKFFDKVNPIGKTISLAKKGAYIVTGVLKDPPGKSHIDFDAYASASTIASLEANKLLPVKSSDWNDFRSSYTYVVLKKGINSKPLAGQLNSLAASFNKDDKNGQTSFDLQLIEKVSPGSDKLYNDIGRGTTWAKIWVGIDVSLLILIAACFNYTNLTIARALTRAKEVGIRKIAGAKRYQLFLQYIIESVMLSFGALAFAWVLLSFIIQYAPFNDGYEMVPSSWRYNQTYIFLTVGFALFTGLLAGAMPAWILSSFKPLRVLKNLSTAKIFGKVGLQKTLIVFQYSLSLVIIIFLFTFYRQFNFLGEANPGFKRENTLIVSLAGINEQIAAQKIAAVPGVESVCAFSVPFKPHFGGMRTPARADKQQEPVSLNCFFADPGFIPAMKLSLLAGRNFISVLDSGMEREIILNDIAAKRLGFITPASALGKNVWINDSVSLSVVGVVNDFKYENAGMAVNPMAFRNNKSFLQYLFVGTNKANGKETEQRIAAALKPLASGPQLFTASWLDDTLDKNNSQRATISLLGYLAFIALSIASLGLLGLVTYTVETKRKEIGIRKIIGGSVQQIVRILSGGFVKLLMIAGLISVPIGYTLSILFLQNFAERVGNGFPAALVCFSFLLLIGLATIMSQTIKASQENPVKSLRTE